MGLLGPGGVRTELMRVSMSVCVCVCGFWIGSEHESPRQQAASEGGQVDGSVGVSGYRHTRQQGCG